MNGNKDKTELFENRKISSAVATLAIPTVMSTLVMILYNIADTFFVGMLNNAVESAAVSLAAPALLAFNAVNNLFGVGGSSLMSRALGRRDYDTVKRASAFSIYMALLCAILISAGYSVFSGSILRILGADETTAEATGMYLRWTVICGAIPAIMNVVLSNLVRAEGCAMHASIGVMSGCLLNIVLDPFFVLPRFLNMGAAGAGCATFISNTVATLYLVILTLIKNKNTYVCLDIRKFSFRRDIAAEVFGVGLPASIQNLLNVTGSIILNKFVADFGAEAVSAMGIAHKCSMLPMYVSMGISQGVMPLISYNYASGNRSRMKEAIRYVLRLAICITLVLTALFYAFSDSLIRMFMDNDTIVGYGGTFLRSMSLGIPMLAIDFTAVAVFQAIGKGRYSLVFAVLRKVVLEIPAIIILNRIYPLYGMAYSQPAAETVLAIAAFVMLGYIFRNSQDIERPENST